MNLSGLIRLVNEIPAYRDLLAEIRRGDTGDSLGLLGAARPYLAAALASDLHVPIVLIMARPEQVSTAAEELRQWLAAPERVRRFAEPEALPYERIPWAVETVRERLSALAALVRWQESDPQAPVVVTSARALMQFTLPKREFIAGTRTVQVGQRLRLAPALSAWLELGYEAVSVVESPGTFSRRGGLIDIYPADAAAPVRLELFGDEVDSLRSFDPATQRSLDRIEGCVIAPATEALPKFGHLAVEALARLDASGLHGPAGAEFRADLEALGNDTYFRGIEFYIPYLYSHPATLFDYIPVQGLILIDDMVEFRDAVAQYEAEAIEMRGVLQESGELARGFTVPYATWDDLDDELSDRHALALGYGEQAPWLDGEDESEAPEMPAEDAPLRAFFSSGPRYGGQLRRLIGDWLAGKERDWRLVAVTRQAQRLAELWRDENQQVQPALSVIEPPPPQALTLIQGTLEEGWIMRPPGGAAPLYLFTDAEIFGWSKPRPRRVRHKPTPPEVFFADLTPGDYVVHVDFGIGLFRGLIKAAVDGGEREYLRVDYDGGDSVYVPIHHADRLSRYVGPSDQPPVLSRLGTASWERVKQQAKAAALDVARDLLVLYSTREVVPGYAFASDTEWQAELEASFPYIETEDQLQAIQDVKADMEKPRPMDRLICGDVGYGKTEVAVRAAFKAVMDDKQVAVLVPTTVLAQQHLTTFRRRLAAFPAQVEMLSRFRTAREQQEVIKGLAEGKVDIVIGTHRLLSKDVTFKDLGLLIIDEEQRFGVTHKERLKQMRTEVDVLTMTATPIPRTLYLSLTGTRDMSTIDTPPEDRLPIKTHIGQYDETLVRKAILRERDRGGQVFFVHNRVRGIEAIRQQLERLVPEATFAVAHGQMPERELERVMLEFADGEVDVLVCTTIIESGLDIPNANTIIVHRADRFGLAQLYQLRGRVGRGANRAYAYFLYDRSARVSDVARRRLQAILEASELGAGFSVAMRDLEIRGAGEILGTQQSGHMAAVGFDMYCRLLAQAVSELKSQSAAEEEGDVRAYLLPLQEGVQITLPLDVSLPDDYVVDESLRLRLYRRMAGLTALDEIGAFESELIDRFGALPPAAANLLYQMRLKALALEAQVEAIVTEDHSIVVRAPALEHADRGALQRALGERIRVQRRQVRLPIEKEPVWRAELLRVLQVLYEHLPGPVETRAALEPEE